MQASDRSFHSLRILTASALSTPEQFVLGVARCWDAFMDDPDPTLAWRELAPVFAYMNVLGALCAFDCTFRLLRTHRLRPLQFHDTDSTALGWDEARILSSLAHLQRGQARQTAQLLRGALTPQGVRAILPSLARIASALDAQGHRLPLWSDDP
jgi:hypothetical protein